MSIYTRLAESQEFSLNRNKFLKSNVYVLMLAIGKAKIKSLKILLSKGVLSIEKALGRMLRARLRTQFTAFRYFILISLN